MKQRLRDDKKHGVFGATLSNVMWEGVVDSRSCGLSDSFWALDQLSSVENGLCGKWIRGEQEDGLIACSSARGKKDKATSHGIEWVEWADHENT